VKEGRYVRITIIPIQTKQWTRITIFRPL
jgi:hypothetical protein